MMITSKLSFTKKPDQTNQILLVGADCISVNVRVFHIFLNEGFSCVRGVATGNNQGHKVMLQAPPTGKSER